MDWGSHRRNESGSYEIPDRWLYIHHYDALNILFRVENALRVFVFCILKSELRENWVNTHVFTADGSQATISVIARQRMTQQRDFGYLGYPITSPMMFLTSGELIQLVFSDGSWPKFARYFPGKREILKNKLEEIGSIRNSLAHFRPLRPDDVDVLKQNAKHALAGVEKCLSQFSGPQTVVPTNSVMPWYTSLSTIGNARCQTRLYESSDGRWIRIAVTYNAAIVRAEPAYKENRTFTVLNLVSPAILDLYKAIAAHGIFVSEAIPPISMPKDFAPKYRKEVSVTFSLPAVEQHHAEIRQDLESLIRAIEDECELVTGDQLARGKLIHPKNIYVSMHGDPETWNLNADNLACPVSDTTVPEYWADNAAWMDFLDSAHKYPWMPADVSHSDYWF